MNRLFKKIKELFTRRSISFEVDVKLTAIVNRVKSNEFKEYSDEVIKKIAQDTGIPEEVLLRNHNNLQEIPKD